MAAATNVPWCHEMIVLAFSFGTVVEFGFFQGGRSHVYGIHSTYLRKIGQTCSKNSDFYTFREPLRWTAFFGGGHLARTFKAH